jgi:hypothetical protein
MTAGHTAHNPKKAWKSQDPEGNSISVFPRGKAWYVCYKGETYSFASVTEANRFGIRCETFHQKYPNKIVRRF